MNGRVTSGISMNVFPVQKQQTPKADFQPREKATKGVIFEQGGVPVFLEVSVPPRWISAVCSVQGRVHMVLSEGSRLCFPICYRGTVKLPGDGFTG